MARKKVKLKKYDISQNSGKEISHTIAKIKAHERLYTSILVVIFMILIVFVAYLVFRVDPSDYKYEGDYKIEDGFSYSSNLVFLNDGNTKDNTNEYVINISNMTDYNENYEIQLNYNDDFISKCNCSEKLIPMDKIKYSIDNGIDRNLTYQSKVLSTGFIAKSTMKQVKVKIWIEGLEKDKEGYFYGILDIVPMG